MRVVAVAVVASEEHVASCHMLFSVAVATPREACMPPLRVAAAALATAEEACRALLRAVTLALAAASRGCRFSLCAVTVGVAATGGTCWASLFFVAACLCLQCSSGVKDIWGVVEGLHVLLLQSPGWHEVCRCVLFLFQLQLRRGHVARC